MQLSARATNYIIGNVILIAFASVMVIIRLYLRSKHSRRGLWWDDFFILVSLLLAIAFGVVVSMAMAFFGWDRDIWEIPIQSLPKATKSYLAAKELFVLSSSSIRMALLFFYFSLVRDIGAPALRRVIFMCIILNGVLCAVLFFLNIFECRPIDAGWRVPRPTNGECLDDGVLTAILGGFLCLADIVVNILPMPIVAKLNLPLRQRMTIGILLSLGAVATIAGVVREYFIYASLIATTNSTGKSMPLWICVYVEIYVALICACAPSARNAAVIFARKTRSTEPCDPEHGPIKPALAKQMEVFDGSLFSNFTHISAVHHEVSPMQDILRSSYPRRDRDSSTSVGIHVVTRIHLTESRETKVPDANGCYVTD